MGTIADKLSYLNTTKGKIKDSINLTGANIGNNDTFRSYSAKLRDSLVDIINNGTDELYDNFPKATGTGSEIELNNTYEAPMGIDLKGNTFQQSYSGKNLLNSSTLTTGTRNGITCSYDNTTKIITFNGTCTTDNTIFDFSSTTILFQANKTKQIIYYESGTLTNYGQFRSFNSSYGAGIIIDMTQLSSSNNKMMMSNTVDVEKTRFSFRFNNGSVANNFKVKVMITNDDNTDFEPFVGGTASPNPDYPQDVEVVTGDNEVEVKGKNLFDGQLELGGYTNGEKDSWTNRYRNVNKIPVKPNTTYVFSINGTVQSYMIQEYTQDKTYIKETSTNSITTSNNCHYLTFRCTIADFTSDFANLKIQLEQGSTASEYETFQGATYPVNLGSIELCKIGTYQDYIYKDNDKWYLHEEIGEYTFTGNESWQLRNTTANNTKTFSWTGFNYLYNEISCNNALTNYASNLGSVTAATEMYKDKIGFSLYYSSSFFDNIIYFNTKDSDLNSFKTNLVGNYIYYVLTTATDTEITDTTLKGQLEAIYNAYSYNNQTNISQENAEQPFILNVSALLREE